MKTAVSMQKIITAIAEKYALDLNATESHLRLEQPGYMPLIIEKIGRHLVSVAHYYTQEGDMMADPEIVYFTGYQGWVPIQITQAPWGCWDAAVLSSESAEIKSFNPQKQADLAAFSDEWGENISAQNWLDAKPVI
jgi:hypothetical protein